MYNAHCCTLHGTSRGDCGVHSYVYMHDRLQFIVWPPICQVSGRGRYRRFRRIFGVENCQLSQWNSIRIVHQHRHASVLPVCRATNPSKGNRSRFHFVEPDDALKSSNLQRIPALDGSRFIDIRYIRRPKLTSHRADKREETLMKRSFGLLEPLEDISPWVLFSRR